TSYGYSPEQEHYMKTHLIPSGRGSVAGRTVLEGKVVHIPDVLADPDYTLSQARAARKVGGFRTLLGVPLLREGSPIGVIVLGRNSWRPFANRKTYPVTPSADHAVMPIKMVRLLHELQAHTHNLRESHQPHTATADVLKVISRSTFDLKSVLQTLVE